MKGNRGFSAERKGSIRIIITDKIRDLLNQYASLINYDILMKAYTDALETEWESLTAPVPLEGKADKCFLAAGQSAGLVKGEIVSCKAVIQELIREANVVFENLDKRYFCNS